MNIAGVILAGGQATRMGGGDKSLLSLGDITMLDHVIARISPQVQSLALNANGNASRFDYLGLPVISDSLDKPAGPLAGILAAMDWANNAGFEHVVTVAADTPFFPTDLVAALWLGATCEPVKMAIAATPDTKRGISRHPTFGLWPVACRNDLRAALDVGVRKVVVWADKFGPNEVVFRREIFDPFFNVNTPDDLTEAQRILGLDKP